MKPKHFGKEGPKNEEVRAEAAVHRGRPIGIRRMEEASRLRKLADQCRQMAATLHARETAATLLEMARHFEASAQMSERLPQPLCGSPERVS